MNHGCIFSSLGRIFEDIVASVASGGRKHAVVMVNEGTRIFLDMEGGEQDALFAPPNKWHSIPS